MGGEGDSLVYSYLAIHKQNRLSVKFTVIKCQFPVLPAGSDGKESACNVGDLGLIPRSQKIPWRRAQQPTPVFLPGESHGQRSLVGYGPWGHKELDTTE